MFITQSSDGFCPAAAAVCWVVPAFITQSSNGVCLIAVAVCWVVLAFITQSSDDGQSNADRGRNLLGFVDVFQTFFGWWSS